MTAGDGGLSGSSSLSDPTEEKQHNNYPFYICGTLCCVSDDATHYSLILWALSASICFALVAVSCPIIAGSYFIPDIFPNLAALCTRTWILIKLISVLGPGRTYGWSCLFEVKTVKILSSVHLAKCDLHFLAGQIIGWLDETSKVLKSCLEADRISAKWKQKKHLVFSSHAAVKKLLALVLLQRHQ